MKPLVFVINVFCFTAEGVHHLAKNINFYQIPQRCQNGTHWIIYLHP